MQVINGNTSYSFEIRDGSTMLFNVAVRSFMPREIKCFQSFCDKKCRYITSDRKGEPLKQMQEYGINTAGTRKQIQVSSISAKFKLHILPE